MNTTGIRDACLRVGSRRRAGRAGLVARWRRTLSSGIAIPVIILAGNVATAQELTPRAYWPAPTGTNALVISYQNTSGDIVTDPSLPITGVESKIHFGQLTYQRFFGLLDRTASLQLSLPYSRGHSEGFIDGEFRTRDTDGLADVRARLAINLLGAPAMDGAAFLALRAKPRTIVGMSLLVQAPTGDYDPDRLINIGANRWSAKPAVGMIWPMHPSWLLEIEVGVWLFGDNDDFVGATREQDPILSAEVHLVKRIRPGFWASLDANFYEGGRTTVDGDRNADLQRNSRMGFTVAFPFQGRHALRGSYSTGVVTESGGDFEIVNLSYVYAWQ